MWQDTEHLELERKWPEKSIFVTLMKAAQELNENQNPQNHCSYLENR